MLERISEQTKNFGKKLNERAKNSEIAHGHFPYGWGGTAPFNLQEQPTDLFCGHPRNPFQVPGAITSGRPTEAEFDCSGWYRFLRCTAGDIHPDMIKEWDPSCNGIYQSHKNRPDIEQIYEGPREGFPLESLQEGDSILFGRPDEQPNTYKWNHIGLISEEPGHMRHCARYKPGSGDLVIIENGEEVTYPDMVGGIFHMDVSKYQSPGWEQKNEYMTIFRDKENTEATTLTTHVESYIPKHTYTTAHGTKDTIPLVHIRIQDKDGNIGQGESALYYGESMEKCLNQIEKVRAKVTQSLCHKELQNLLPPGAARTAIDCALHDLQANKASVLLPEMDDDLSIKREYKTCMTIGLDTDKVIRQKVKEVAENFPILKIKCDGKDNEADLRRLQIIKEEAPDAEIWIDANEGWSLDLYLKLIPELIRLGVTMIEQPFNRNKDECIRSLAAEQRPIPLCADESCQTSADIQRLKEIGYDIVNIKLVKTGGYTQALETIRKASEAGFEVMLGNQIATTRGIEPLTALAGHKSVKYLDLDGPLLIQDGIRSNSNIQYNNSIIHWEKRGS